VGAKKMSLQEAQQRRNLNPRNTLHEACPRLERGYEIRDIRQVNNGSGTSHRRRGQAKKDRKISLTLPM